ncbi:MAG: hypothetical protein EXQ74_05800 [Thermoleophilia bacterium]|nr:hypothetical protein [Thermoleophilia bacterium]
MNRSRTAALFAAAALLTAGGLAGCGGSEKRAATAAGETRMTVEEYVTAGNTLCRDANETIDATEIPTDVASLRALLTMSITIGQGVVDDMAALNPPEELVAANTTWIAQMTQQIALLTKIEATATDGADFVAVVSELTSAEFTALEADTDATATELGLTDCVDSDSAG